MERKHCGKRENFSLRAISPFSHGALKRLVLQTRKNQGLFGKGLKHEIDHMKFPCIELCEMPVKIFENAMKGYLIYHGDTIECL